ncbi:MAG: DUF2911 domain-containing protein [Bacteroidota bacterium]
MKKLLLNCLTLAVLALSATLAQGQIQTPSPSPTATLGLTVGLTDVEVTYSRPSMKDRKIYSKDGLVPFGKVWRTGANAATKFTFSDDVTLAGQAVKAGAYAVLTKPGAKNWEVMLFPYEKGSWSSYTDKTPAATLNVKPVTVKHTFETFTIDVNNIRDNSATIDLLWENTAVSIPMTVAVDERVMAAIERTLSGPSPGDYYAAGSYMHSAGKDLNKALEYVQKATKVAEPRYWQVRREALILADLGRKSDAIAAAKKSLELATKAGNEDYIRMNKKSIKEWSM